jgi:hypothetical protein
LASVERHFDSCEEDNENTKKIYLNLNYGARVVAGGCCIKQVDMGRGGGAKYDIILLETYDVYQYKKNGMLWEASY